MQDALITIGAGVLIVLTILAVRVWFHELQLSDLTNRGIAVLMLTVFTSLWLIGYVARWVWGIF